MSNLPPARRSVMSTFGIVTHEVGMWLSVLGLTAWHYFARPDGISVNATDLLLHGVVVGVLWTAFYYLAVYFGGTTVLRNIAVSFGLLQICAIAVLALLCRVFRPNWEEIFSVEIWMMGLWLLYIVPFLVGCFVSKLLRKRTPDGPII